MTEPSDSLTVTDLAAARALRQQAGFLGLFADPRSPTQAARAAGIAPNLAHHHARQLTSCGLLFEQRREGGRVYFQLTAREFRVPSDLLPPGEDGGNGSETVNSLSVGFLRAYERSWAAMHAGEEDVFTFGTPERPAPLALTSPAQESDEPYPTHADVLTLRLSPGRYRQLAADLSRLLTEAAAEGVREQGQVCTLAVLAFAEPGEAGVRGITRNTDSFLDASQ